ncbi:hypothetical protein AB0O42_09220 [Streptomyces sp. NPDC089922]|uniref:hypothetical protein n=1 Tax=Streptomyces sp. NPDC089922 TaxID=3155189 RepID=UPI00343A89C9
MANWRRSFGQVFWVLDRALGGQRRPTTLQKRVARHPIKAGLCVAVPVTLLFVLFSALSTDTEKPASLLFAVFFGPFLGVVFGLTAAFERLRQRRLERLGTGNGS